MMARIGAEDINTLTLSILGKADSYHRWIFQEIKPYLQGGILEAGCGIGHLTNWLLGEGKVLVADINKNYLQVVERKFKNHSNWMGGFVWDLQEDPPEDFLLSIHTIVCINVLEHIKDDLSILKRFYKLLPLRGRLVCLVPALRWLYNPLDKELGHFRRYSKKELYEKLILTRFRILTLRYFNLFGVVGWFLQGTVLRKRLLSSIQVEWFNRLVPLFISIENRIPTWFGQSLIAVGEKSLEGGLNEAFGDHSGL